MITFELQSEFGDGLSTGEGQGVGWEEVWPRGDTGWALFPSSSLLLPYSPPSFVPPPLTPVLPSGHAQLSQEF